jgi:hypothetical protein
LQKVVGANVFKSVVSCPATDPSTGDVSQQTQGGGTLYQRASTGYTIFFDGNSTHWQYAVDPDGTPDALVWTSGEVDAPDGATTANQQKADAAAAQPAPQPAAVIDPTGNNDPDAKALLRAMQCYTEDTTPGHDPSLAVNDLQTICPGYITAIGPASIHYQTAQLMLASMREEAVAEQGAARYIQSGAPADKQAFIDHDNTARSLLQQAAQADPLLKNYGF